jgi:hypothetical protein
MVDPDELPEDPDLDAVPAEVRALDGQASVHIADGIAERVGVVCVTPSVAAAYARRAREQSDEQA